MVQNQVIELNDREVEERKQRVANLEIQVEENELKLADFERRLEADIDNKLNQQTLEEMEKQLKEGKGEDEKGNKRDLTKPEKELLELKIKSQKELLEKDIFRKRVRNNITNLRQQINQMKNGQIKPLKKQIRERRITTAQA